MHWVLMPFRRVFDYSGRSSKKEFFFFFWVFWVAVLMSAAIIYPATQGFERQPQSASNEWFPLVVGIYVLVLLVPTISLMVRRLHDADFSGWWLLAVFVPLAGAVALIGMAMWFQGTPGPNRYGPQPDMHARRRARTV